MASFSEGKLTFGPPGSQWIYDRQSKTYDLTRSSSPTTALKIATTCGPPSTSLLLSPAKTALVVIDMQNFFLHPSCREHPTGLAAIPPLVNTIRKCRETGVKIIWCNWGLTDTDLKEMPAGVLRGFASRMISSEEEGEGQSNRKRYGLGEDLGEGMGRTLFEGAWNSQIFEGDGLGDVVDREKDIFVTKNRMSGLWCESQPLWRYLRETEEGKGKETLLFAGVNTDQCVLGTLTNAYSEYLLFFSPSFFFLLKVL